MYYRWVVCITVLCLIVRLKVKFHFSKNFTTHFSLDPTLIRALPEKRLPLLKILTNFSRPPPKINHERVKFICI